MEAAGQEGVGEGGGGLDATRPAVLSHLSVAGSLITPNSIVNSTAFAFLRE